MEVQHYCLDIFENISSLLVLRGPSDFYLACLKKMIFESDRARILGALRSLIRLTNEKNEKIILQIDTPVLQRLLQLLLVPDEEIVLQVMVSFYFMQEFFYLFTNISPDAGARITGCVRFNVIDDIILGIEIAVEIYTLERFWNGSFQCDNSAA
jgi:hypothetical protein